MGHRAYYPAYDYWVDDLEPDFQLFINPLVDNLSRKIRLVDLLAFVQTNLQFPLTNMYVDGVTITGTGTEDDPFTASTSGENIYNTDGLLTGNRILNGIDTYSLSFSDLTEFNLDTVYFGLVQEPPNEPNLTQILGRNELTGEVQYLAPEDIYSDTDVFNYLQANLNDSDTINFTYNLDESIDADVRYQMSITSDASGLKFVNDQLAPATGLTRTTRFYYGTDYSGTKGYHKQFLQFDGGNVWSPYLSDLESAGTFNFGASSGINIGTNFGAPGPANSVALVNSHIIGYANCYYATNIGYSNIFGHANYSGGLNPLWHITVLGYDNASGTGGNQSYNTLIGTSNLTGVTNTASYNVALGFGNLTNVRGNNNIGIGFNGLYAASGSTGARNIGIGETNGGAISTGSYNIFLGWNSGASITSGSRNIFIGDNADGVNTSDYQLVIGNITATSSGTWIAPDYLYELGFTHNLTYDNVTGEVTYVEAGGDYSPTITADGTVSLISAKWMRTANVIQCIVHLDADLSTMIGGNAHIYIPLPVNTTLVNADDILGFCKMEVTNESAYATRFTVDFDSGVPDNAHIKVSSVGASWTVSEHFTVIFDYLVQ